MLFLLVSMLSLLLSQLACEQVRVLKALQKKSFIPLADSSFVQL